MDGMLDGCRGLLLLGDICAGAEEVSRIVHASLRLHSLKLLGLEIN